MSLEGMVALVTGASSGIGAATAGARAAEGAIVAGVARRAAISADLTDRELAIGAVERVVAENGRAN